MTDEPVSLRRRDSDDRIDRIEGKVDAILEKLEDPKASPVGRILSDRADRNERRIEALDVRLVSVERILERQAGAMGFVKAVQVVLAIVTAAVALFVAIRGGVG